MSIFGSIVRPKPSVEAVPAAVVAPKLPLIEEHDPVRPRSTRQRTGRTEAYSVRVRDNFKREMLALQAEIQLERQKSKGKARKVTEGEVIELMMEALKTARRNGDVVGPAVPIADDIWQCVHEIARLQQIPAAQVIEELVVQKVAELGFLPRNT